MREPIIYNKLRNNFTQVSNIALLDVRISSKAYKLYAYLCYRIGISESWRFNKDEILKHFKEGEKAMRSAFNELIECGFLERKRVRNDKGFFEKTDYTIYAEPVNTESDPQVQNRHVDNRHVENPHVDNAVYSNREIINKDKNNKDFSPAEKMWNELKEREKYNFEIDEKRCWQWIEDEGEKLKISKKNAMKSWAEKPRNQIKKSANPLVSSSKLTKEVAQIAEIRSNIKFWLAQSNEHTASQYFSEGQAEIDLEKKVIYVKSRKALQYQDILDKINIKIEFKS